MVHEKAFVSPKLIIFELNGRKLINLGSVFRINFVALKWWKIN